MDTININRLKQANSWDRNMQFLGKYFSAETSTEPTEALNFKSHKREETEKLFVSGRLAGFVKSVQGEIRDRDRDRAGSKMKAQFIFHVISLLRNK